MAKSRNLEDCILHLEALHRGAAVALRNRSLNSFWREQYASYTHEITATQEQWELLAKQRADESGRTMQHFRDNFQQYRDDLEARRA